jgi:hypothetical protein
LSILDENANDIKIHTNSIEFFIPQDPNLIIPSMIYQNVTLINEKNFLFYFFQINLTKTNPNLTYSIHLEIHPFKLNISYLIIYQFDQIPLFNSRDNWRLFCPSSKFYLLS